MPHTYVVGIKKIFVGWINNKAIEWRWSFSSVLIKSSFSSAYFIPSRAAWWIHIHHYSGKMVCLLVCKNKYWCPSCNWRQFYCYIKAEIWKNKVEVYFLDKVNLSLKSGWKSSLSSVVMGHRLPGLLIDVKNHLEWFVPNTGFPIS